MTQPIYVVPDIHGQLAMLRDALERIERDGGPDAKIVFLGDYVDRGPDSCGVIDTLIKGQSGGKSWITIRGNHDQMFLDFLKTGQISNPFFSNPNYTWLHERLGGATTLASYNVFASEDAPNLDVTRRNVPNKHIEWLANLPYTHEVEKLLFVHAGIRPQRTLEQQTNDDLIWIRKPFGDYAKPHPWLVVHGHTALDHATHFGNRINLDGGAGWGRPLNPAVFEGTDCWLLTPSGREPLVPGERR